MFVERVPLSELPETIPAERKWGGREGGEKGEGRGEEKGREQKERIKKDEKE